MGAAAQSETVWLQIEARRSVASASEAARSYAQDLENVTGFSLGNGFYGVALGPYTAADAQALSAQLKAQGRIPQDAYIVSSDAYGQQFYPVGTGVSLDAQPLPEGFAAPPAEETLTPEDIAVATAEAITQSDLPDAEPPGQEAAVPPPQPAPEPDPEPEAEPEETRAQALASEDLLNRDEKRELQTMLQWAGFYNSAIDGLFGGGTRGAMSAWQEAKGYEPTGVLTTRQREELFRDFNAILDGLDLATVRDDASGIQMVVPVGVVAFTEYAPPFVKFEPISDALPAEVYFISQAGNEDRFFGLYEILQTLDIVPEEGPRERSGTSFEIEGRDADRHTYIRAQREGDAIKGFMLVWPAGDEERRSRVLQQMRASFTTLEGVLDPGIAPPDEDQAPDLLAGLQIRQPQYSRSGFFIDAGGSVLTTSEVVEGCGEITIEGAYDARIVHSDPETGIAVLRATQPLAPRRVAEFQTSVPRLRDPVAVAGYPFGGVLSAPAMSFGTLADLRGLNGEEELQRLELAASEGDAGGPVFDGGGAVLGMLASLNETEGRVLPQGVSFAVDSGAIIASVRSAGLSVQTTDAFRQITPELQTLQAADVTVLVSCW
ncbi:serine protease [Histidinibacterium lentulum]|nr:serine protease [Histidinibacterium lentulum]